MIPKDPKEAVKFIKDSKAVAVDFKFNDFLGLWQHFSTPVSEVDEAVFEEGLGFDGSSIRGWQPIHASDMLVMPDPTTAKIDPFCKDVTVSLICNIVDPITKQEYSRDPRNIAPTAAAYVQSTGIGDTVNIGPEPEFFIFDDIRYGQNQHSGFYFLDSIEGQWNTGRDEKPKLGYKPRYKEGYFPVAPTDSQQDIRAEMCIEMEKLGYRIERQHHEVATAGQAEIDMRFLPLVKMGDCLMWFKHVCKNVAFRHGKTVTFMPKPIFGDNGSGMHVHQSIWKGGKPLFAGDGYGGMSELAMHYIAGVLKHAGALAAFTNPSTNSYRRLVPGFEAPVNLAYSSRNRSAAVRFPDPTANGYLAFSAMMMAGLDGIQNKLNPGGPLDKDIYSLSPEELKDVPSMPASLDQALDNLKKDHAFPLKRDVFTEDVIETWIDYKMPAEVSAMRLRPHPHEFALYFDA